MERFNMGLTKGMLGRPVVRLVGICRWVEGLNRR